MALKSPFHLTLSPPRGTRVSAAASFCGSAGPWGEAAPRSPGPQLGAAENVLPRLIIVSKDVTGFPSRLADHELPGTHAVRGPPPRGVSGTPRRPSEGPPLLQISQLNALITLLIGNLSAGDRMKVMTICTIDVHARDVVAKMIVAKAGAWGAGGGREPCVGTPAPDGASSQGVG